MKKMLFLFSLFSLCIILFGCGKQNISDKPIIDYSTWWVSWALDHNNLSGVIPTVLTALKHQDFAALVQFVWPQWLRFSPYEYVNTQTDVILDKQIVENALTISRSYVWWLADGKWDPIDLWIWQYFEKFVNDADYINASEILYNKSVQRGNTINNIAQVYQGKTWVEFYFSWFDAQYEGMDWKSLTLVFDHVDGQWYLIWVVHSAWTI